jgi:hypothetical protein
MLGGARSSLHGFPFNRNCTAVMAQFIPWLLGGRW